MRCVFQVSSVLGQRWLFAEKKHPDLRSATRGAPGTLGAVSDPVIVSERSMVEKGALVRAVLYAVVILYLVTDLFVIGGPLRRSFARRAPDSAEVVEAAKGAGVVARIHYQPILLSQVNRRLQENLWRTGRKEEGLPREERLLLRRAALNELIDLHLLRLKVRFSQSEVPVAEEEIAVEVASFTARFPSEQAYLDSLQEMGWSEKELRFRIAARIQQEKYLASMIDVTVGEEEAEVWYEENREQLGHPDRVRARHIFRSTVGMGAAEAEEVAKTLEEAREALSRGAEFAELARRISEDRKTSGSGGSLGWLQPSRVPEGLEEALFKLEPGNPVVVQTGMGWHLLEVLEKRKPRERTFAEAREEVLLALEAVKRRDGLKEYRRGLREREKNHIEVFFDVLERGL